MKDLESIAFMKVLEMGTTTEGPRGTPINLKPVLLCDSENSFDEIKAIAEEHDLEIIKLHRKERWEFWTDKGWIDKPYKIRCEDYGDNYREFGKMDEIDYIKDEIIDAFKFNDCEDFEELNTRLQMHETIYDAIEEMEDDEIVIIGYGEYYETIKKEQITWCHDTNVWTIGLREKK